ncbi:MAG: PAQR family membrane homeostasis protein TrhA [Acidimicrobiia bacterium]
MDRPHVHLPHPHVPHVRRPHLPKPRLRGRLHQIAFFVSIPAGIALVALARGVEARIGAMVFAATLSGLYGVSAAYHRGRWSERAHQVWKRLDHSMIFVFIAGTYTPVTLLALHPAWGITLLALAWSGAVVGILISTLRLDRWHGVGFALYLVLGWLGATALYQLARSLSPLELALLVTGGLLYTVGAVILARRRPDPRPAVFGYHEIWHSLVVGASVCHFVLILLLVRS